ncbi:MAG: hypothetical protein V1899_11055 [Planctomycetota bacterium]
MTHPSLAGMVEAIRAKISREALHLRFTAKACVKTRQPSRKTTLELLDESYTLSPS